MKYRAIPGVIRTGVCGKTFLVSPGKTMRINGTASFCWELLEQGADEETMFLCLRDQFEAGDTEVLRSDIRDLLKALYTEHLIERCRQ